MMQGKDGPRKIYRANLQRFRELMLQAKPQPKRGSFTKVDSGDTRAISKPKNKKEKEKTAKKEAGRGHKPT